MRLSAMLMVTFLVGLVISCVAQDSTTVTDATILQGKTWCTVKPGAPDKKLQLFLDVKCGTHAVDCKEVNRGGSCFEPNTLQNHASYVLNLYYRNFGVCDQEIGLPSITDPSFGRCRYT